MLVSVILPVKNAEGTIHAAVKSILHQTLSAFELIVIDDNCTDRTLNQLKAIEDERIIMLPNKGSGIADALNTGLAIAKGKYIARMDADDISHPTRLEKQLQFMLDHPKVDIVSCFVSHNGQDNRNEQGYSYYVNWLNAIQTPEEHFINRFVDAPVAHPTVFFKSELIPRFGSYSDNPVPEDFELWLRWMERGVSFAKVPETLYHWLDYPTRTSRTHANYKLDKFYQLKAKYFARWWMANNMIKEIWIWGYGKDVFRKSLPLTETGINIAGYIDIIERPNAKRRVRSYRTIIANSDHFYLIYIGDRNGKQQIIDFFADNKMKMGEDYLFMS